MACKRDLTCLTEGPARGEIVQILIESDVPLTPRKIIERGEFGRSTFYRHVDSLIDHGFLRRLENCENNNGDCWYDLAETEITTHLVRLDRALKMYDLSTEERYQQAFVEHLGQPPAEII